MSGLVLFFPVARQTAKLRRVADVVERSEPRIQAAYRGRVLADLARLLARQGADVDTITAEVLAFDRALLSELWRRAYAPRQSPGGSAA